ncbi:hypothetical protein NADFUDRAFT_39741 [Nadsonia fulvescens var. elongata DSM 6958]|uniref:PIN domain-containing protein n=1 Tax=Nadsonia fulvescens var. elongata DSM 6958 TaxID=857566 RepID=A0A1E3PSU4_9ASCO|nr:hypothetical protein NADFUDRAFT_39741 [Nadsonia fulvescens var. elongata DSM 6958]
MDTVASSDSCNPGTLSHHDSITMLAIPPLKEHADGVDGIVTEEDGANLQSNSSNIKRRKYKSLVSSPHLDQNRPSPLRDTFSVKSLGQVLPIYQPLPAKNQFPHCLHDGIESNTSYGLAPGSRPSPVARLVPDTVERVSVEDRVSRIHRKPLIMARDSTNHLKLPDIISNGMENQNAGLREESGGPTTTSSGSKSNIYKVTKNGIANHLTISNPVSSAPSASNSPISVAQPHVRMQQSKSTPSLDPKPSKIMDPAAQYNFQLPSIDKLTDEIKQVYKAIKVLEVSCQELGRRLDPDFGTSSRAGQVRKVHTMTVDPNFDETAWWKLCKLHKELVGKYFDFIFLAYHSSGTPETKLLVSKYHIATKLLNHGIFTFLESLKWHIPLVVDITTSFIFYCFEILTMLVEPHYCSGPIWMESLGDLAKFGISLVKYCDFIDWAPIAGYWYGRAIQLSPGCGRLYHNYILGSTYRLGSLFYFCKSMTCWSPYPQAKNSINLLFHSKLEISPSATSTDITTSQFESVIQKFIVVHRYNFIKHGLLVSPPMTKSQQQGSCFPDAELKENDAACKNLTAKICEFVAKTHTYFALSRGPVMSLINITALLKYGEPIPQGDNENPDIPVYLRPLDLLVQKQKSGDETWSELDNSCLQSSKNIAYSILNAFLTVPSKYSSSHVLVWLYFIKAISVYKDISLLLFDRDFPWDAMMKYLNGIKKEFHNFNIYKYENKNQLPLLEEWKLYGFVWSANLPEFSKDSQFIRPELIQDIITDPLGGESNMESCHNQRSLKILKLAYEISRNMRWFKFSTSERGFVLSDSYHQRMEELRIRDLKIQHERLHELNPLARTEASEFGEPTNVNTQGGSIGVNFTASDYNEDDDVLRELKLRKQQLEMLLQEGEPRQSIGDFLMNENKPAQELSTTIPVLNTSITAPRLSTIIRPSDYGSSVLPLLTHSRHNPLGPDTKGSSIGLHATHCESNNSIVHKELTSIVIDTNIWIDNLPFIETLVDKQCWNLIVPFAVVTELQALMTDEDDFTRANLSLESFAFISNRLKSRRIRVVTQFHQEIVSPNEFWLPLDEKSQVAGLLAGESSQLQKSRPIWESSHRLGKQKGKKTISKEESKFHKKQDSMDDIIMLVVKQQDHLLRQNHIQTLAAELTLQQGDNLKEIATTIHSQVNRTSFCALVTNDKNMRVIGRSRDIRVLSFDEFKELIKRRSGSLLKKIPVVQPTTVARNTMIPLFRPPPLDDSLMKKNYADNSPVSDCDKYDIKKSNSKKLSKEKKFKSKSKLKSPNSALSADSENKSKSSKSSKSKSKKSLVKKEVTPQFTILKRGVSPSLIQELKPNDEKINHRNNIDSAKCYTSREVIDIVNINKKSVENFGVKEIDLGEKQSSNFKDDNEREKEQEPDSEDIDDDGQEEGDDDDFAEDVKYDENEDRYMDTDNYDPHENSNEENLCDELFSDYDDMEVLSIGTC